MTGQRILNTFNIDHAAVDFQAILTGSSVVKTAHSAWFCHQFLHRFSTNHSVGMGLILTSLPAIEVCLTKYTILFTFLQYLYT